MEIEVKEVEVKKFDKTTEKYCKDCGTVVNIKAEICPNCGVRQVELSQPQVVINNANTQNNSGFNLVKTGTRSKYVAAVLAFTLGGLGIHKLYLGRTGMCLLYILFCATFIPAIIGFLEGFVLLSMKQVDFDMEYNSSYR
jgi:TM2 domain-containing membrane protein YozV